MPQQLGTELHWTCYIACNFWQIRLSFMSEAAPALGAHLYIKNTGASLYSLHPLQIVQFIESRHATRFRGRHGSSRAALLVLPGDEPTRVGDFRRTSALCVDALYERIRPASKVKICVCLSLFVSPVNLTLVTFTHQHGGNKFTMVNCAVVSNDFCQLIEISYRFKIFFYEKRLSYTNIGKLMCNFVHVSQ